MRLHIYSLLLFLLCALPLAQGDVFTAKQTDDLVTFVESLRQCRGIVGLTVAVVKGNETWTRGFGAADLENGRNVTTSDLFGIGSLTKAFSTALISLFINETGRFKWQTPVVDILGKDFEFTNEQLTSQVTLKDLLTHRTGLDSTNIPLFAGSNMTRDQFAQNIRYLPVRNQFRDEFEYNNWMYGLVGHVTEVMGGGATWEELLEEHLLKPLNMSDTRVMGKTVTVQASNFAKPYVLVDDEVVPSDPAIYSIDPQEAAGAIASSADDMAQWLLVHINGGKTRDGRHVLNDTRLREMSAAHVGLSADFRAHSDLWKPQFPVTYASDGYGYGWVTASYRGYPMTWHSGGVFAYTSYLAFLPHLDLGFFVSTNGPGSSRNASRIVRQVFFYAADLLLEEEPWLNLDNACQFPELWLNKSSDAQPSNDTVYDDPDFLEPETFTGRYEHPLFGSVDVVRNGSRGLYAQYGRLEGRLYRNEEEGEHVAMMEVEGSMEFVFRSGNKSSYLHLNFSRPTGQERVYQGMILSSGSTRATFEREGSAGGASSGGHRVAAAAGGLRDVVAAVVLVVCLSSLGVFSAR
ncbi:uncharacterized protein LOC143284148 [Babylonia areolata]|uniref:uncharacterized protein LOC143284148 n=1 Tax=Babylonia areolata TaxID=304850 RepID=UPI003FD16001